MVEGGEKVSVGRRRLLTLATVLAGAIALLAISAASAGAIEIRTFDITPTTTQAGAHPDLRISYYGESRTDPRTELPCQCNDPKNIDISFPTGFIGNPHATPQCKAADFAREVCPADSQVGTIGYTVELGGGAALNFEGEAVYNSVPRPDQAGLLSIKLVPGLFGIPLYSVLSARTGSDYGLNADTDGLERGFALEKFHLNLWGVPADESHTPERIDDNIHQDRNTPSSSPLIPFLQNPGVCGAPLTSTVHVLGYDGSESSAESAWPQPSGCDLLNFNPSLSAKPTTTETDSASGVEIDLTVPQLLSPVFPSPSEIRAATVTLPEGFSINPNAADGKTSCSDAEANFHTEEEAHCPEYSKVGTDTIDSSALPAPVPGGIYLGEPQPGNRYRIFLTGDGYATHIKLAGTVHLDPNTGRLVASFENLPQSPLTEFNMHFFGAERGLLATPTQCGDYAVHSTFVPWDEDLPSQSSTQFFTLDSGPEGAPCPSSPRSFSPTFAASSDENKAGAYSHFSFEVNRNDGDQNMSGITVVTPPGFTAKLAGVSYCPESDLSAAADPNASGVAQLASPSCPASSQIGTSIAGAGAGTHPVYLEGKVYLAGPYKGAPLSLVVITPAVSGPYDLGNVVVRSAIQVDPLTAQVTTVSDPLPRIVDGIPLRLRAIKVDLDRSGFALDPTNCDPLAVSATILGEEGAMATPSAHYQVANCAILPYEPGLSLKLTGGVNRRGHPAIHALLTAKPGEANTKKVSVALPRGEQLDNSHFGTVCTRVDFADESCPPGSRLGTVEIDSPLLEQPLTGFAYLRSSSHGLPDLALKAKGQVEIEAIATIDSVHEALRATFKTVPDVPFSSIRLDLEGGKKGLIQNSEGLCGAHKKATVKMTGQNGAEDNMKAPLGVSCGSQKSKRHKRHRSHLRRVLRSRGLR